MTIASVKVLLSNRHQYVTCHISILIESLQSSNWIKFSMISQCIEKLVHPIQSQWYPPYVVYNVYQVVWFINFECRLTQTPILVNLITARARMVISVKGWNTKSQGPLFLLRYDAVARLSGFHWKLRCFWLKWLQQCLMPVSNTGPGWGYYHAYSYRDSYTWMSKLFTFQAETHPYIFSIAKLDKYPNQFTTLLLPILAQN